MRGHICFGALPGQTHNWRLWRPFDHPPRLVIYLHSSVILVRYTRLTVTLVRYTLPPLHSAVTLVRYTRPLHSADTLGQPLHSSLILVCYRPGSPPCSLAMSVHRRHITFLGRLPWRSNLLHWSISRVNACMYRTTLRKFLLTLGPAERTNCNQSAWLVDSTYSVFFPI